MRTFDVAAVSLCVFGVAYVGLAACSDDAGDTNSNAAQAASSSSNASSAGGAAGAVSIVGGADSSGGSTSVSTGSGALVFVEAPCVNQTYQCGDTRDNDADGLVDWQDPDCLGPCDNTEDSYYPNIPGQPGPACIIDCYWDSNSGSGNDECCWSHECDSNEIRGEGHPEPNERCPYDPDANPSCSDKSCDELAAQQSTVCADICGPLTPNGCDCFGCCELPSGSGQYVWVGSEDESFDPAQGTCTIEVVNDPTKCEPCVPVPSCLNTCERCEICVGKPTVPTDCTSDQCPSDVQPCGLADQEPCQAGYYCITGCCEQIPK
jgi:hypothetical protein